MKKSKTKKEHKQDDAIVNESRFDASKPQFRKPKQHTNKIVLDDRFSSVLTDSRFQLDIKDKYGRKKKQKKQGVDKEMSEFYTIANEKEIEEDLPTKEKDDSDSETSSSSSNSDSDSTKSEKSSDKNEKDDDDEKADISTDPASRIAYLTALSRGEIDVSSSDSSSDEEDANDSDHSDSDIDADPVVGSVGILDPSNKDDAELTYDQSQYMAICNMDWDHVKARDIFAITQSFAPPGSVRKVSVYPSDFGIERMAIEDKLGPQGLWKKNMTEERDDNKDTEQEIPVYSEDEDEDSVSADKDSDDSSKDADGDDGDRRRRSTVKNNGETTDNHEEYQESDFDPEKLRAYEASKLKYYFAVVEFTSPEAADAAYKEIDGLELEHSSAALDMRQIPADEIDSVIANRTLRDEATTVPGNYAPPEFVVSALQQTNVNCTWEEGDLERERKLTKYGQGTSWHAMAEDDDLKAYIASDNSSDDSDDSDGEVDKGKKASKLRKMLGLDSGDESNSDSEAGNEKENDNSDSDNDSSNDDDGSDTKEDSEDSGDDDIDGDNVDGDAVREFTFTPGEEKLEDKIRSKLQAKNETEKTPWEKYLEKRKLKRREKKQAAREKREEVNKLRRGEDGKDDEDSDDDDGEKATGPTREELELLVAGDGDDDLERDYDMRGIQRIEKNKDKKLRGSRKRKENKLAQSVTGTNFEMNTTDDRFKVLLDGSDDRFGIDRTNPNYKETPAMKKLLDEQTKRRKKKRQKVDTSNKTDGSTTLQKRVETIKAKFKK